MTFLDHLPRFSFESQDGVLLISSKDLFGIMENGVGMYSDMFGIVFGKVGRDLLDSSDFDISFRNSGC